MRRAFPSWLVVIAMVVVFASIGEASATRNRCKDGQEQTGCVLHKALYYGHSGSGSGVQVNSTTPFSKGFFMVGIHAGNMTSAGTYGLCIDAGFEVKQKLRIGTRIKFNHTDPGNDVVSGSLKVYAKKGTMKLTVNRTSAPVCHKTVTISLKREQNAF